MSECPKHHAKGTRWYAKAMDLNFVRNFEDRCCQLHGPQVRTCHYRSEFCFPTRIFPRISLLPLSFVSCSSSCSRDYRTLVSQSWMLGMTAKRSAVYEAGETNWTHQTRSP